MRPLLRLSVLVIAVAGLGAGCAGPSLGPEADELRTDIAGLPGVTSAQLDYSEPVPLDSGKLALEVELNVDATPDQVVAVVQTAYDAFSSRHHDEEADLSVRTGRTTIALRSFQPEASSAAVGSAVSTGLVAAPESGSVTIDLTTDGVPQGDHVAGTYLVSLPTGSTFDDVPVLLASLARSHPDDTQIGWGGVAADGASLSYDHGFPSAPLIGRWERMQVAAFPLAVRALEEGALFAQGRLADRYDVDDAADRRRLDRITHSQLRALGDGEWVYTVHGPRGAYLAEIDRYLCESVSEGPYDDELEAWVIDELGPCDAD